MAYTQTPGFTKEMGAGITKVINNLQQSHPEKQPERVLKRKEITQLLAGI
jgi:hypothetical protein